MDAARVASGLLSTVVNPDDGDRARMLQVFALPAPPPDGERDVVVLKLVGELCAYSAGRVGLAMRWCVDWADSVVIDLSDLWFLDAAGLQLLNDLARGRDLIRLENVNQRLSRIFEIAGLSRLLHGGQRRAAN